MLVPIDPIIQIGLHRQLDRLSSTVQIQRQRQEVRLKVERMILVVADAHMIQEIAAHMIAEVEAAAVVQAVHMIMEVEAVAVVQAVHMIMEVEAAVAVVVQVAHLIRMVEAVRLLPHQEVHALLVAVAEEDKTSAGIILDNLYKQT